MSDSEGLSNLLGKCAGIWADNVEIGLGTITEITDGEMPDICCLTLDQVQLKSGTEETLKRADTCTLRFDQPDIQPLRNLRLKTRDFIVAAGLRVQGPLRFEFMAQVQIKPNFRNL